MLATSKFAEDNSNSPDLFCYKQPPQTPEPKDSNQHGNSTTELFPTKKKKSSEISHNSKGNDSETDWTPGPGTYSPECSMKAVYRAARSSTFHRKYKDYDKYSTPGPAAYNTGECFSNKPHMPQFSLSRRHTWYRALFITKYE